MNFKEPLLRSRKTSFQKKREKKKSEKEKNMEL